MQHNYTHISKITPHTLTETSWKQCYTCNYYINSQFTANKL